MVTKILCMVQRKVREDDPMPVAKAFGASSLILGVGIPVSLGAMLALFGWALAPLIGSLAWDPFLTFVADSRTPLGLAWLGLGVITFLLFLTALLEVKECREASTSTFKFHRWLLRHGIKNALAGILIAPLTVAGCPAIDPTRRISLFTSISGRADDSCGIGRCYKHSPVGFSNYLPLPVVDNWALLRWLSYRVSPLRTVPKAEYSWP